DKQGHWSPQGGFSTQGKCSEQNVDCGPVTAGLKSDTHAVLLALKEATSVLSIPEGKIMAIDKHAGISFAGSAADARQLCNSMRSECQKHRAAYDTPLSVDGLATFLGNQMQAAAQSYDRLPYKVGLLVAGYDHLGPHIYQACSPSGDTFECKAMAIGDRSQSACTYLEKHLDEFKLCNLDELVKHGLRALRSCLPTGGKLTNANVSIAIVGQNQNFTIYEDNSVAPYVSFTLS
ncbi:hypothetical protein MTO96_031143, partial [Rhipicephalus appendiculatus]